MPLGGGLLSLFKDSPALHPSWYGQTQGDGISSELAFLEQWRGKTDMSEALLRQHAQWLRGFRNQVGVQADDVLLPLL
jgi:hypothetical protein